MKRFPEQLLAARKASGLTQEQLAEQMNVSRPMISHWETGRSLPDLETVRRLCQVLGYNFLQEGGKDFSDQPEAPAEPKGEEDASGKKRSRTAFLGFLAGAIVTVLVALIIFLPMLSRDNNVLPEETVLPADTAAVAISATHRPYTAGNGSPAWYQQPNERVEGQAYLAITTPENPLRVTSTGNRGSGSEWHYIFYLEEKNGIDFTVEDYSLTMFYTDTRTFGDRHDGEELASWWGSNTIPGGGQQMTSGSLPQQPMKGIGVVFAGVDEHGNELAFHYYLELSREVAQSTIEESAAAEAVITDMLAWCKTPNERVEGQAYVNISVEENPQKLIRSDLFANGLGWQYAFFLLEEHGIDFTVEEITEARFFTEKNADVIKYTPANVWGTDVIRGWGGTTRYEGAFHVLDNMLGVGFMITGTDAKGNALEFHYFLELSHEVEGAETDGPQTDSLKTETSKTGAPRASATAPKALATDRPEAIVPEPTFQQVFAHRVEEQRMVKVNPIEWYLQPNEPVKGQAYLAMSVQENPLRAFRSEQYHTGAGWYYYCNVEEQNGVDFTVNDCSMTQFNSNGRAYNYFYDADKIKEWWGGSNVIPAGESRLITGGFSYDEVVAGEGILLTGVDANGNELEFYYYIEMSHEVLE